MTETLFSCEPITPPDPFWVFAYGSLMWNPEFSFEACKTARLDGYHRALCIYSIYYRGTQDQPGLVLGLDLGGSCQGRAYLVAAEKTTTVLEYLTRREMRHGSYCQAIVPVRLNDGRLVEALTYVANHDHQQYIAEHEEVAMAKRIVKGVGAAGQNIEYLANTVVHLLELGIDEPKLRRVLDTAVDIMGTETNDQ